MENLSQVIQELFDKAKGSDPDIIRSLFYSEHAIEQDYRGRFILELLQNARDAAINANVKSRLKFVIESDHLLILNNGSEFTIEGLRSICRIGLSTKKNNNAFIGHKGLGFKSILEISNQPRITTAAGTVYFNQQEAYIQLGSNEPEAHELPLLFFPLFAQEKMEDIVDDGGYTTAIKLPYLPGVTADTIRQEIKQIKTTMFPLLGNFEQLDIVDHNGTSIEYKLESPDQEHCVIHKTGEAPLRLRILEHRFFITPEVIVQLSADERELVKSDTAIEIRVALKVDKDGRFVSMDSSPLCLFYPLEENSGLRFICHSLFVVTPNRKNLLDKSVLNRVILSELVQFLSGSFLDQISKEFPGQAAEIMLYSELLQGTLSRYGFFKSLQAALKNKPILWNDTAGRHLATSEFYLLSAEQYKVFKEPKIGDKYIVYIGNQTMYHWLTSVMGAESLPTAYMLAHIEQYSEQQIKSGNISFFTHLYNFARLQKVSIKGKKVLLSQHKVLLDGNSEVYYGGHRSDLIIPGQLKTAFTFLHESIKMADFRGTETYTGVIEYNTERLTSKAIKLFGEDPAVRPALLLLFRSLFAGVELTRAFMEKLLLPITGEAVWVSPFFSPVYIKVPPAAGSFSKASVIDMDVLLSLDKNRERWETFLKKCNAWTIPALYVKRENEINLPGHLEMIGSGTETSVVLENDIILDIPHLPTPEFQQEILEHRFDYLGAITRFNNIWSFSRKGGRADVYKCCSFFFSLSDCKWIYPSRNVEQPYRPSDLFGLPSSDEGQQGVKAIHRYNATLFLPETELEFLSRFGLIDLRRLDSKTAIKAFALVKQNCNGEPPQETDFISAWNKLYGFVYEFWRKATDSEKKNLVDGLKSLPLLAETSRSSSKKWGWTKGADILYIDDKPLYDYIPTHIPLPSQFTKRDRNEIGVVLQRVGIVLSQKIQKELQPPAITKITPLIDSWHWIQFVIPVIENALGYNLEQTQLDQIGKAKVAEVSGLTTVIRISLETYEEYAQGISYYLNNDKGEYTLLINNAGLQFSELAHATNEFLTEILHIDFDVRLQVQELSKTRTREDAMKMLDSLNIDSTRMVEINEAFNNKPVSPRIRFWNAIATLFSLGAISEESEIPQLAGTLGAVISPLAHSAIISFDQQHNLNEKWNQEMAAVAGEILRSAGKDPELLVRLLEGIIDFDKLSQDRFYTLLADRRSLFVASLYGHLSSVNADAQPYFLQVIGMYGDLYKKFGAGDIFIEPGEPLVTKVNQLLADLSIDEFYTDDQDGIRMNEVDIYNKGIVSLRLLIRNSGVDEKPLGTYLENINIRSQVCFDQKKVFDQYTEHVAAIGSAKPADEQVSGPNIEQPAPANTNPIIPTSTRRPPTPGTVAGGNSSGRGKGTGGGFSNPGKRPSQETLDAIGMAGELYVYQKLQERYSNVEWLSGNAQKAGYILKGDDSLGYDIRFVDEDGALRYAEVKATSGQTRRFQISAPEVTYGLANASSYKLFFVTEALDNVRRTAFDLGFIFKGCFTAGDFVNSDLFYVEASEYTVTFEHFSIDAFTRIINVPQAGPE